MSGDGAADGVGPHDTPGSMGIADQCDRPQKDAATVSEEGL